MITRSGLALLAALTCTSWALAQECPTWSPGEPVNLKSPYRSLCEMLGLPCCGAAPPAIPTVGFACGDPHDYQSWCGYPCYFWLSAEASAYWMKSTHLPALATANGSTVLGGDDVDPGTFGGGRFT